MAFFQRTCGNRPGAISSIGSIAKDLPGAPNPEFSRPWKYIGSLLRKQKARPGLAERAEQIVRRRKLALGFDGFFYFALFFLFLFLELVADEFKDGHFRAIAHADAGGDDAGVAARAV